MCFSLPILLSRAYEEAFPRGQSPGSWGLTLALAEELDWDAALVRIDDRFENDEWRMIALAPETGILYYVAFVDRGEARRIISLRRANRREVKHYVQSIETAFYRHAYFERRQGDCRRREATRVGAL